MEQTVGEIIDALSKFDRNTRIADDCSLVLKYDSERCRLIVTNLWDSRDSEYADRDE